jgi:gamma-glutamyl:cysteine ligase YbdK (ATP-grasp superfamily)
MQEKAAAAAAAAAASTKMNATAASTAFKAAGAGSSPKQDYLEQQRKLEEEIARYDEEIKKSGKLGITT